MTKARWGLYNEESNTWHYQEESFGWCDEHQPTEYYERKLSSYKDKGEATQAAKEVNKFCNGMFEPKRMNDNE
jgi:hypothetical protein